MQNLMRLILASQSPRRREMLRMIGLGYEAVVSDVEETAPPGMEPAALVEYLAHVKAEAVLKMHPDACIIGADTVVHIGGAIIGKPHDDADAARILRTLSGRTHKVYTGVAILKAGYADIRHAVTEVTFRSLSDEEILWYVGTGEPRDKAGAYGIQGPGGILVDRIDGNYFNVIGMPLPLLYKMLLDTGAIAL